MPRKQFIADLQAASESTIQGISGVARGTDDESVYATYTPSSGLPIEIELLVQPDLGSYPSESFCMVFSRSIIVPDGVGQILQGIQDDSNGLTVMEILGSLSQKLQRHLANGTSQDPCTVESDEDLMDIDEDTGDDDQDDDQDEEESAEEYFGGDSDHDEFNIGGVYGNTTKAATFKLSPEATAKLNHRIRADLRAVRFSEFKIGILIGMKADTVHNLLSVSIQVTKLGLSEEAMQAWDLEPQQYIVFLIRYSNGYKTFDAIIDDGATSLDISFRVGVSNQYKPTVVEALAAFSEIKDNGLQKEDLVEAEAQPKLVAGFSSMFISSSLEELINKRFISLLKIRNSHGFGWEGAKKYYSDKEGRMDDAGGVAAEYYDESAFCNTTLPDLVNRDHLVDNHAQQISFPVIAMQFMLRCLTRCTEFCLVCHDKMKEDFEALKPYVCDKPLCLYQYMNLGFGPSVEHEILTQPWVVDLLVSFCHSAALARKLREYPVGMSLAVPPVNTFSTIGQASNRTSLAPPAAASRGNSASQTAPTTATASSATQELVTEFIVKYDSSRQEVIFDEAFSPVRVGDWIVLTTTFGPSHFRVEDASLYPTITVSSNPVTRNGTAAAVAGPATATPNTPSVTPPPNSPVVGSLFVYNQNFDDMDDLQKAETITMLIETLPSIKEIKAYLLQQSRTSQPNLRKWNDRISPAALGMLRWIIASNRSCIVQVDRCPGQDDLELLATRVKLDQRLSNVSEEWVQFRFAQGSPDKEQRFLNALRAEQANIDPKYPTIFAFHGSPLQNWHSIIRTGLDFKETLHGRAYGHGVYHAQDQLTSVGYTQQGGQTWQASDLKISSAMSLNEIVNCPDRFTSKTPHLVIQFIDWIQCRYLMVQTRGNSGRLQPTQPAYASYQTGSNSKVVSRDPNPSIEVAQDPAYQAKSTLGKTIGVPLCATSTSRAFRGSTGVQDTSNNKKRKASRMSTVRQSPEAQQIQSDSDDTDDCTFLISDDEDVGIGKASKSRISTAPSTEFVPGSLDQSTLPMLDEPQYATPGATKSLNRALREILDVQKKTPLHELGWYINPELISNVYQWIVELHSFEPELPLSQDMKSAGVTSIVMEIRFGKDFPFSPPFLRVIRPRFLPFTLGGGGHVTLGGAMCMELLTNSGWSSVSSIEGVLLQVRLALSNLEPRPARLEGKGGKQIQRDYGTGEAMAAYVRACATHGWKVPDGFKEFASGADPNFM